MHQYTGVSMLACLAAVAFVSAALGSDTVDEGDSKTIEQIELTREALVYLDGGTVYRALYKKGRFTRAALSSKTEVVEGFAVANGKCLLLLQGTKKTPGQAKPGKAGVVGSTVPVGSGTRKGIHVMTVDISDMQIAKGSGLAGVAFNGEAMAYVVRDSGESKLCVLNMGTGKSQVVVTQKGVILAPAWSPDGKRIAYYSSRLVGEKNEGLAVGIVDARKGEHKEVAGPSRPCSFGAENRNPLVWSGTGETVYIYAWYKGEDGPGVYAVSADGGERARWLGPGYCASVDAKHGTLYVVHGGVYSVAAAEPKKKRTLLAKGGSWPRVSASGKLLAYVKGAVLRIKVLATGKEFVVAEKLRGDGRNVFWESTRVPAGKSPQ